MKDEIVKNLADLASKKRSSMLELLEEMLNINSFTYLPENIDKINDIMERELKELGFSVERIANPDGGGCLVARYKVREKPMLLIGHTDMAIPLRECDSPVVRDGIINCPGAIDMKSGLVNLVYSLKLLKELNLLPDNISIVLSGDEEQGSPFAKEYIYKEAAKSRLTISLEAARINGDLVEGRKGAAYFDLVIKGRAAHTGTEYKKGISAIEEMAYKIIQIHQLTELEKGVTANVGYVIGGNPNGNAVADNCRAKVDIKFMSSEEGESVVERLKDICKISCVEGTSIELNGGITFPPMTKTKESEKIIESIKQMGRSLGLTFDSVVSGEADAGHAAAAGIPCVDGLGPVGGGHHTYQEYLEVNTMPERCALLALCILNL